MLHRLRHRTPLPPGTKITLSDTSYIIQKLLDCGGSSLLYEVHPVHSHRLPLILKEQYPLEGYIRQEEGLICPAEAANTETLTEWYQQLQAQETHLSQLASRHNFQVIPIREQVSQAVITLPGQPGRVVSNHYTLMDDCSAQGLVLSACADAPVPLSEAVSILKTVLSAYAALHRDGFLHGDCSMANIMLLGADTAHGNVGTAHLLDFGCARRLTEDGFTDPITGPVYSTDGYCAPELLYALPGSRLTAACDVWSLGFLLLELLTKISRKLTGVSITEHLIYSFRARQVTGTMAKQLCCDTASLHCVNTILERALDENPERRYPNAGAMLEDILALERCLSFDHSGPVDRWLLWHSALRFRQREPDRFLTGHIAMGLDTQPITLPMQAQLEEAPPESALPLLKKLIRCGESVYLHAPGGGGKSILAAQLMTDALSSGEWVPLYLELSKLRQCTDSASCRQQLLHALAVQYFGDQEPNTVQQIAQWMAVPSKSPGCLLILNDLHKLSPSLQPVLSELIASCALGQNTVVLVTGRTDGFSLRRVRLIPLSHRQICDTLHDIEFRSEEFLPLYELLSLPLFLMRYLELVKGRNGTNIPYVTTPTELLLLYFGEREYHAHDSSIHQTLTAHLPFIAYQWIRTNQTEVSYAQLEEWLKEQMGWMYTPERLEEFLRHCTGSLCVLHHSGDGSFRFSHDYNLDYFAASFIAQQIQQALSRQDTYPLRPINHPWINTEQELKNRILSAFSVSEAQSSAPYAAHMDCHFTYLAVTMAMELCPLRLNHGVIQRLCDHTQIFTDLYTLLSCHPTAKTDANHIPYTLYHTFTRDIDLELLMMLFEAPLTLKTPNRPSDAVMQPFLELASQWGNIRAQLELIRLYWHKGDWDTAIVWCRQLLDEQGSQPPKNLLFYEHTAFLDTYRKLAIGYWWGLGGLTIDRIQAEYWLTKYGLHDPMELFRTGQYFEFQEPEDGAFVARALEHGSPFRYNSEEIFPFQEPSRAALAALCYQIAQTCITSTILPCQYAEEQHTSDSYILYRAKKWRNELKQNRNAAYAMTRGDFLWQAGDLRSALGQYRLAYRMAGSHIRPAAIRRLIRCNEDLGDTNEAECWREKITPSDEEMERFKCCM